MKLDDSPGRDVYSDLGGGGTDVRLEISSTTR